jgi:hypothetical protein
MSEGRIRTGIGRRPDGSWVVFQMRSVNNGPEEQHVLPHTFKTEAEAEEYAKDVAAFTRTFVSERGMRIE